MIDDIDKEHIIEFELEFNYVRSPGPGGQNVNKTSTAAQLRFHIEDSKSLDDYTKTNLQKIAANKINGNGELVINSSKYRSQGKNRLDAIHKLFSLIERASYIPKKRKVTKPTMQSREDRISDKKKRAFVKSMRRIKPQDD